MLMENLRKIAAAIALCIVASSCSSIYELLPGGAPSPSPSVKFSTAERDAYLESLTDAREAEEKMRSAYPADMKAAAAEAGDAWEKERENIYSKLKEKLHPSKQWKALSEEEAAWQESRGERKSDASVDDVIVWVNATKKRTLELIDEYYSLEPSRLGAGSVVVYAGVLLGGWNGAWVTANDAAEGIVGGETYNLYSSSGPEGTGEGSALSASDGNSFADGIIITSNGSRFMDLAVTGEAKCGKYESLNTNLVSYINLVKKLLSENGLEDENVHIQQIIKTDLENDGFDEIIVASSNLGFDDAKQGLYSFLAMEKIIKGNIETIVLFKDIEEKTQVGFEQNSYRFLGFSEAFASLNENDANNGFMSKYKLSMAVDVNLDGAMELLVESTQNAGRIIYVISVDKAGVAETVLTNRLY
ncbi:MAG: hypothetical protein LBU32_12920 [Clostridiales bacterium]|jgi:hypothetical protein|nr:hypothetical protein [Clostridiales bacterium]